PRLTDANAFVHASARLIILERVWGTDSEFLDRHGDRYTRALSRHRLLRARWLIHRGRTREARQDLGQAGDVSFHYRLLASLPGTVVRALLACRRAIFST